MINNIIIKKKTKICVIIQRSSKLTKEKKNNIKKINDHQ